MSFDVNNQAHLEALRWACEYMTIHGGEHAVAVAGSDANREALRWIKVPASAASLVRDLLARAGVTDHVVMATSGHFSWGKGVVIEKANAGHPAGAFEVPMSDVPYLILALLDRAPGDRDSAMQALREAGR